MSWFDQPRKARHGRVFHAAANVLASAIVAGMVAGAVAVVGAPGWAVAGFGLVAYLTVAPWDLTVAPWDQVGRR